jgi:hypothetical protein
MAMSRDVLLNIPVPLPADWARLHQLLVKARSDAARDDVPTPPVPLILAGAAFSTSSAIRERWIDLLVWAVDYGFADFIVANPPPPPPIDVANSIAGVGEDGAGWWPVYGNQVHPPVSTPRKNAVQSAIALLRTEWPQIAGPDLAKITTPLRLLGTKKRRLLVAANPDATPPWGAWESVRQNPNAFTLLRQSINARLAPLGVDEITFATNRWSERVA